MFNDEKDNEKWCYQDEFCSSFLNGLILATRLIDQHYNNLVLTGLFALYEICFEQAGKAIKEIMEQNGIHKAELGSPRQILKSI